MKAFVALLAFGAVMFAQAPSKAPASTPAAAKPSLMNPASLREKAPETFKAKFATTKGDFVIEVTRAWSPNGADRFYNLVKNGYYTDCSFFRVIAGFMAQFGMHADPKINRVWANANIKDDPKGKQRNLPGTVTFAMSSLPNSRSSQVFINLVDNSRLDPDGFTPFGKVVEGMDVVKKLYSGYGEGSDGGGRGPTQGRLAAEGKAYLDKSFPKLDSIKTATIVE